GEGARPYLNFKKLASSFRGASATSEPGIHCATLLLRNGFRVRCFASPRNDGVACGTPPRSRGAKTASESLQTTLPNRGRRKRRVPTAPAASRAKMKAHEQVTTGKAGSPGVSCATVLTAA